jgi:hypothetical protein
MALVPDEEICRRADTLTRDQCLNACHLDKRVGFHGPGARGGNDAGLQTELVERARGLIYELAPVDQPDDTSAG